MPYLLHQSLIYSLIISFCLSSVGFKKTVWFVSMGYAWSMVGLTIFLILYLFEGLSLINGLQILALLVWGLRLGVFLLGREQNLHYQQATAALYEQSRQLPVLAKMLIWICVSILYVCMFSPALFAAADSADSKSNYAGVAEMLGVLIMWVGLILEGVADRQKSAFKRQHPHQFARTGLYQWIRYPNYFGEILVWVGNFVVALAFYHELWQWLVAGFGLICIVLIMIGSTKRLEAKQESQYGDDPAFQQYVQQTPILLPWLPVYSFKKVRIYLG